MSASVSFYFRPVDTFIRELSRNEGVPTYQIITTVNYYTDEAMLNFSHSKQYTFNDIPYDSSWDGMLTNIYQLVIANV